MAIVSTEDGPRPSSPSPQRRVPRRSIATVTPGGQPRRLIDVAAVRGALRAGHTGAAARAGALAVDPRANRHGFRRPSPYRQRWQLIEPRYRGRSSLERTAAIHGKVLGQGKP